MLSNYTRFIQDIIMQYGIDSKFLTGKRNPRRRTLYANYNIESSHVVEHSEEGSEDFPIGVLHKGRQAEDLSRGFFLKSPHRYVNLRERRACKSTGNTS